MAADPGKSNRLPHEIDDEVEPARVTAHAGVPLPIELFRKGGAAGAVDEPVKVKQRQRGLSASRMVESLVALWAAGGDRCSDLGWLRSDAALGELLGHEIPAANTMRDFLEGFHAEDLPLWRMGEKTSVPMESAPLMGLGMANRKIVAVVAREAKIRTATLDVDATILESHKREAAITYEGSRGFQPVIALWAELDLVVHDEFRDGNVPAACGNVRVVEQAVSALPEGVNEIFLRGDSALYDKDLLAWCEDRGIGYAISADMTTALREEIERLPEGSWRMESQDSEVVREWAEVAYVPDDGDYRKDRPCVRRYLALRIRKRQGSLFADGSTVKRFAVVTNREGDGLELIRWHRQKAGTVEHAHHVLKNELAAEALPSGKFGANAAWFRMNTMTYNLLSALKRVALPGEFLDARPKRLRFLALNTVGKVVCHARRMILRLASEVQKAVLGLARGRITLLQPA